MASKLEIASPEKSQKAIALIEKYIAMEHAQSDFERMLGLPPTKPTYKPASNNQTMRQSYPQVDMKIVSVAGYLSGGTVNPNDDAKLAELAFRAIQHYASLPKVQIFFLLPYNLRKKVIIEGAAIPSEEQCRLFAGTENLLLEIYEELSQGEVITDKLVDRKIDLLLTSLQTEEKPSSAHVQEDSKKAWWQFWKKELIDQAEAQPKADASLQSQTDVESKKALPHKIAGAPQALADEKAPHVVWKKDMQVSAQGDRYWIFVEGKQLTANEGTFAWSDSDGLVFAKGRKQYYLLKNFKGIKDSELHPAELIASPDAALWKRMLQPGTQNDWFWFFCDGELLAGTDRIKITNANPDALVYVKETLQYYLLENFFNTADNQLRAAKLVSAPNTALWKRVLQPDGKNDWYWFFIDGDLVAGTDSVKILLVDHDALIYFKPNRQYYLLKNYLDLPDGQLRASARIPSASAALWKRVVDTEPQKGNFWFIIEGEFHAGDRLTSSWTGNDLLVYAKETKQYYLFRDFNNALDNSFRSAEIVSTGAAVQNKSQSDDGRMLLNEGALARSLRRCEACGAMGMQVGLFTFMISGGQTQQPHEHQWMHTSEQSVLNFTFRGNESSYLNAIATKLKGMREWLQKESEARFVLAEARERIDKLTQTEQMQNQSKPPVSPKSSPSTSSVQAALLDVIKTTLRDHLNRVKKSNASIVPFIDQFLGEGQILLLAKEAERHLVMVLNDGKQHSYALPLKPVFYHISAMPADLGQAKEIFVRTYGGYTKFMEQTWGADQFKNSGCSIWCHIILGKNAAGVWIHMSIFPVLEEAFTYLNGIIYPIELLTPQERQQIGL
ncbi:MAG: hypothetical protein AAB354_02680 [candidate division KSB1 bacterium]